MPAFVLSVTMTAEAPATLAVKSPNITDVVNAGDVAKDTTGYELTIKEEGRPPWAGGPKALLLVPWPSEEDW